MTTPDPTTDRASAPVVLITGVTGGFGRAFATAFHEAGFRVAGVSRRAPDGLPVDWHFPADLTESVSRREVVSAIRSHLPRLDVLVHNAGIGLYDRWEDTEETALRQLVELNLLAPILITRELLPMLKPTGGVVVTVSSAGARIPVPVMGAYCMSKAALSSFSDSLRAELVPEGVHVLDLIVGRINTGFSNRAMGSRTPPETPFSGRPDILARRTVQAAAARRRRLVYPGWYRFVIAIRTLAPGLFDRLAMKKWESP